MRDFIPFIKTPLALLGVDLKNSKINKICHFANHPYLYKGLKNLSRKFSICALGGVFEALFKP